MKRISFYLAHPAHFHLFKNVIHKLRENNQVSIVYNDKDVLAELIKSSDFFDISHKVKTNKKVNFKFGLLIQFIMKNWGAFLLFRRLKPKIVVGTPILIALISRILPYDSIIVNEDDFDVVKKTADFGYPYADHILCPTVCRTTIFEKKCIKYSSYHELAYLHPNNFKPSKEIACQYVDTSKPYFIIRFAKLIAHHDEGIKGLNLSITLKIIEQLKPYGNIFITSERSLEKEFEQYRISINPKDMHHVMAFAKIYIGDSQTMAAEAGVLGVPFVRFNDFVGRISYLDELENNYQLGCGIKTDETDKLYQKVRELLEMTNRKEIFHGRRKKMLSEKVDYAAFLTWFIEEYPKSVEIMRSNPEYQYKFK